MNQRPLVIGAGGCGGNILEKVCGLAGVSARLVHVNRQGAPARKVSFDEAILADSMDESSLMKTVNMDGDPVILVAGLGGATGTAAVLAMAKVAEKMGKQTYAVLARPFEFEGPERHRKAEETIRALEFVCRHVIVLDNRVIRQLYGDNDAPASQLLDKINGYAASVIGAIVQKGLPEEISEAVEMLSETLGGQITVGHYGHAIDIP